MANVRLSCPGCGHELDIQAMRPARFGDLTMCWRCTTVGVVDCVEPVRVHAMTDEELRALAPERRVLIETAVRRTLARMRPIAQA
jgi:hypothetical protein